MENNQLVLSLCIPTNGMVEWVIPVLDSIYSQGVDNTLFEVVVTDNGGKPDLAEAVKIFNYENFHYYQTTSLGFTNQIDAFEKCSGLFCKMLNHRSRMLPGSIKKIIDLVEKYKDEKPILYCAEGYAKGGDIIECDNIDDFVRSLSYWISWSAGTGVWKTDLVNLREKEINSMFPHTLFLFGLREETKYVIWNGVYEKMSNDVGKGGYDLFKTFGVSLLDILNNLRILERISLETYISTKKDLYRFLCKLYFKEALLPSKHTFIIQDVATSIDVYWGRFYYYKMLLLAILRFPYMAIRRLLKL